MCEILKLLKSIFRSPVKYNCSWFTSFLMQGDSSNFFHFLSPSVKPGLVCWVFFFTQQSCICIPFLPYESVRFVFFVFVNWLCLHWRYGQCSLPEGFSSSRSAFLSQGGKAHPACYLRYEFL